MTCLLLKMRTWDSCTGCQSPVRSSQKKAQQLFFFPIILWGGGEEGELGCLPAFCFSTVLSIQSLINH